MSKGLTSQFARFCLVGAIGFAIDGGLLWLVVQHGIHPLPARALSFPVAVAVTWAVNRTWTFEGNCRSRKLHEFNRYFFVQLAGLMCNLGLYALTLGVLGTDQISTMIAFATGSFFAMFLNFAGARYILHRNRESHR